MYPKHFYETYLRYEASDQVFVATPFSPQAEAVTNQIIVPAIQGVQVNGRNLVARLINRGTHGAADIHAAIFEAILRSRLVIADLTVQANYVADDGTRRWQPNSNVTYEVGLAAAWRNPEDILLIHRDHPEHAYSFDVQNLRHVLYSPDDPGTAIALLATEIVNCLNTSKFISKQALDTMVRSLSPIAVQYMHGEASRTYPAISFTSRDTGGLYNTRLAAISELLSIGSLKARHIFPPGERGVTVIYEWTDLGLQIMKVWKAISDE